MSTIKHRVFEIIQAGKEGDRVSKFFDLFIIILIVLNVIMVIADTFTVPPSVREIFGIVETVSVIIFTIEYLCRIWTSDYLYPELSPAKARIKYIFSFMALIDLLAILPFYIPYVIHIDLRVLRLLRMIRLLRIFKVNRYTDALTGMLKVFKAKASQLFSSMLIVFLLMIIASVIIYSVENPAQPDKFENAFSGLWWAIATLTTVGYGDIYPITALGKILSAVIAVLGIGLVAVPTGIISAGFMEQIQEKEKSKEIEPDQELAYWLSNLSDDSKCRLLGYAQCLKEKENSQSE